jgi:hypothetical protein
VRDDQYVLNQCTPYLVRLNTDERHNFGFGHYPAGDPRGRIRDAWRFPVVDACDVPPAGESRADYNDVTFVFHATGAVPTTVGVAGSFANLYEPTPLRQIVFLDEPTPYFAVTLTVPRQRVFVYRFVVDGVWIVDPINPQRVRLDNGVEWSRFFTWECTQPIVFERSELAILTRLCNHILPFRTREGQRFLSYYYESLDASARLGLQRRAYRLDDSAGAAIYIDHILAREEGHYLGDYRTCLRELDRLLRIRDPLHEPADVSKDLYVELYDELAKGKVNGWKLEVYDNPRHFLNLLRRHAFTGAFSHPKYGGNAANAGWAYLAEEVAPGSDIFDWGNSLEQPLGRSHAYLG